MRSERRRILVGLLFAVLLTVLAFVSVGCVSAATTHYVNPGESIQDVVDVADPGDTVIVRDGTYTENVEVNVVNLTLRSENGSTVTTVVAAVNTSDVILVTANSVTITGFTVRNATSASGIYLGSVHHCTVSGNNVSNNWRGIYLCARSNNNTLVGNIANSNKDIGILLYTSRTNNLTGNTANSNNFSGIYLYASSNNNTLKDNTAKSNRDVGIYFDSSSNDVLMNNTANSNNNYGIYLSSSSNNNITSNTANSNNNRGIYLHSSSNNTLTGNIASNNSYGIYLGSSSSNNLTGNIASSNNATGIWLYYSSNNHIYNNYFDNTQNAYDNGINIWNITKTAGTNIIGGSYLGGNYWSDYTGEDTDGDGIGDTMRPYNSSDGILNGGDWLPLVKAEELIFDTDEGTYPSISGTFTGTITPSRNLTVSTLYTYSCTGTGGHTKSIELYDDTTPIASGAWSGYQSDWHNITFTEVTLLKDHEYQYVIETGSYPQIIHAPSWNAIGGVITCEEFVDVNGNLHEGWIPAIRLS